MVGQELWLRVFVPVARQLFALHKVTNRFMVRLSNPGVLADTSGW